MKLRLLIAYDGTCYSGWQVQPNGLSVQEVLQRELGTSVTGAGRTDAGVHALGQVAHVDLPELPAYELPPDIQILSWEPAPDTFHARYSATGKIYHYHLALELDPKRRNYVWHQPQLDQQLLAEAAQMCVGTEDFSSFVNVGGAGGNPVRTLRRLDIVPEPGGLRLEFEADGFLYKMVRNLTGTLVEIATHRRPLEDLPKIFAARDRRAAGQVAPPQGLCLYAVQYPE